MNVSKTSVYVDGRLMTTLRGDRIVAEFLEILNTYVDTHYAEAGQPVDTRVDTRVVARAVPAPAPLV